MPHVEMNWLGEFVLRGRSTPHTVMVQQYCDVQYDPSYGQE